jgi:hypothetical protein
MVFPDSHVLERALNANPEVAKKVESIEWQRDIEVALGGPLTEVYRQGAVYRLEVSIGVQN